MHLRRCTKDVYEYCACISACVSALGHTTFPLYILYVSTYVPSVVSPIQHQPFHRPASKVVSLADTRSYVA